MLAAGGRPGVYPGSLFAGMTKIISYGCGGCYLGCHNPDLWKQKKVLFIF